MLSIIVVLVFALLWFAALWLLAGGRAPIFAALALLYAIASAVAHHYGWLHSPRARSSRFVRFVQRRICRASFDQKAKARLRALARRVTREPRPVVFACAPHQPLCLHMALGFAAHGGARFGGLPRALAARTYIAAHWAQRLLPLLPEFLALFGVTNSTRRNVERVLARNDHLCIAPDGIAGKMHAITHPPPPKTVVLLVRRAQLGWLTLAARHNALVVPVLSPNETHHVVRYGARLLPAPLVFLVGANGPFSPLPPSTIRVANPIDTRRYAPHTPRNLERMRDDYIDALRRLAAPDYTLCTQWIA